MALSPGIRIGVYVDQHVLVGVSQKPPVRNVAGPLELV
jgi:hypothetical protein